MSDPAHIGKARNQAWLMTDDMDLAATSLSLCVVVPGVRATGGRQNAVGAFVPIGKATAKTASSGYLGGVDGGCADSILAEYVPGPPQQGATAVPGAATGGLVFVLRQLGERDPRFAPWIVGKDIKLVVADPSKPSVGHVVRGSMAGDKGFDAHVFIGGGMPDKAFTIILHHETKDAPIYSTLAYEGDGTRPAMMSDALRIGAGVDALCQVEANLPAGSDPHQTLVDAIKKPMPPKVAAGPDWVYLNATDHGGPRFSGYLAARFAEADAFLSFEAGGPMRQSSSLHDFALTRDKRMLRRGALSIANALWTNGNPAFDAPLAIEEVDEPPVTMPEGHPIRCPIQFDPLDFHGHQCKPGKRPKLIKVHTRIPIVELPKCKGATAHATVPGGTGEAPVTVRPATEVEVYSVGSFLLAGVFLLSHPRA